MSRQLIYIGNYTKGDEAAIYHGEVAAATGSIELLGTTPCTEHPSYLALHPRGDLLYAVHEVNSFDGGGASSAWTIDRDSGDLTFINQQPTVGSPCHHAIDATGRYVMCSNYGGGSWCMHPIAEDGSLVEMCDFRQHEGSGPTPRQSSPHPHSINISADNRYVHIADLGMDEIVAYRLDLEAGKLVDHGTTHAAPGAGPRHIAFHPNNRYGYLINEIGNTITVYTHDAAAGTLSEIQDISTIPDDFEGDTFTATLRFGAGGRFLYGSNRGYQSIAIYTVAADGRLTLLGFEKVPDTPRDFNLDLTGRYLYSGGHSTDVVVIFGVNQETGLLTLTGAQLEVPSPVCMAFLNLD